MEPFVASLFSAVLGGLVATLATEYFSQKREWQTEKKNLLDRLDRLYDEIIVLLQNPCEANHHTFYYLVTHESQYFKCIANGYYTHKRMLDSVSQKILELYSHLLGDYKDGSYEQVLLKDGEKSILYPDFVHKMQDLVLSIDKEVNKA